MDSSTSIPPCRLRNPGAIGGPSRRRCRREESSWTSARRSGPGRLAQCQRLHLARNLTSAFVAPDLDRRAAARRRVLHRVHRTFSTAGASGPTPLWGIRAEPDSIITPRSAASTATARRHSPTTSSRYMSTKKADSLQRRPPAPASIDPAAETPGLIAGDREGFAIPSSRRCGWLSATSTAVRTTATGAQGRRRHETPMCVQRAQPGDQSIERARGQPRAHRCGSTTDPTPSRLCA